MHNIKDLLELQAKLDQRIFTKFNLIESETYLQRKLALLVELAELANETRSFKFWSLKSASNNEIILEEYVDCLHFFLSLGITMNVEFNIEKDYCANSDINEVFLLLFTEVSNLTIDNHSRFLTAFNLYVYLGEMLGFTFNDIIEAYLEKNRVNHERQNMDY